MAMLDDIGDAGGDDRKRNKDELNLKRMRLEHVLDGLKGFTADELIIGGQDLPRNDTAAIDYGAEDAKAVEDAGKVIDAICENYVLNESLFVHDKIVAIRESQKRKLAELQILVDASKESVQLIRTLITGGDMSPDMFKTQIVMQAELRQNIEARTKHLIQVEEYWETLMTKLGQQDTSESKTLDSTPKNDEQPDKPGGKQIMTIAGMADMMAEAQRQLKEWREQKKD